MQLVDFGDSGFNIGIQFGNFDDFVGVFGFDIGVDGKVVVFFYNFVVRYSFGDMGYVFFVVK